MKENRLMRLLAVLFVVLLAVYLPACGTDSSSGGGGGGDVDQSQTPDAYVDAVNGSDLNSGTSTEPYKTITYALRIVGPNKIIKVLPGIYDLANGETFPLELEEGQVLIGDEPNKGSGTSPTLIVGIGTFTPALGTPRTVTIEGSNNSRISGFSIGANSNTVSHWSLFVDQEDMQIFNNTFIAPTYAGVKIYNDSNAVVENNVFDNSSYGVYAQSCQVCPTIQNNIFNSISLPIDIIGTDNNTVIRDNTITGNGQVGIQVQHGHPLIENNTFDQASGYTYGAIRAQSSSATPKVRGNIFSCTTAVRVDDGNPDLGTASEPGNNNFSSVSGFSIIHNGDAGVTAIGNTWPSSPPVNGVDISFTSTGSVTWGTGVGETYP